MKDAIDVAQRLGQHARVANIARDDLEPVTRSREREVLGLARAEVVQNTHGVAVAEQTLDQVRSDEPGPARDEQAPAHFHAAMASCRVP